MSNAIEEKNKELVLEAFDTLFNQRDYIAVMGWPGGSSIDSQDTLAFDALSGVRSMNEIFSLENADDAYERMMSGNVRFRSVLTTGH
jgi:D-arabinose 1-dehydrogenase-like Zn-dependent alcohol dehydrogenase